MSVPDHNPHTLISQLAAGTLSQHDRKDNDMTSDDHTLAILKELREIREQNRATTEAIERLGRATGGGVRAVGEMRSEPVASANERTRKAKDAGGRYLQSGRIHTPVQIVDRVTRTTQHEYILPAGEIVAVFDGLIELEPSRYAIEDSMLRLVSPPAYEIQVFVRSPK